MTADASSSPNAFAGAGAFAVLGATGGIGSATARLLAERGVSLLLLARDGDRLQELGDELGARTARIESLEPDALAATLKEGAGGEPLGGVAHCIGSLILKPAHATSPDEWQKTLEVNLTSAFGVVRAARKLMTDGGAVVLVSSAAARTGMPNHEAIAAAKAGLEGLARSAAATYARRGLRFHCVSPGLVRTPMTADLLERDGMEAAVRRNNPMQHIGEPEEVARAIVWLLDPANSWVTGQVLAVDGGLAGLRSPTSG